MGGGLAEHAPGEVHQGDLALLEVDADAGGDSRVGVECQNGGAPPGAGGGFSLLDEDASPDQGLEDAADSGGAEAGAAGQFGLRTGAVGLDEVEQQQGVAAPQVLFAGLGGRVAEFEADAPGGCFLHGMN